MSRRLLALVIAFPLAAAEVEVRNVYLPPCSETASFQMCALEIKVSEPRVWLKHPCTVFLTNEIIQVSNGVARANLIIDLNRTQSPFPVLVMAADAGGNPTITKTELRCHLSLVTSQHGVQTQGVPKVERRTNDR